jgi:hypothetical protein
MTSELSLCFRGGQRQLLPDEGDEGVVAIGRKGEIRFGFTARLGAPPNSAPLCTLLTKSLIYRAFRHSYDLLARGFFKARGKKLAELNKNSVGVCAQLTSTGVPSLSLRMSR